MTQPNVTIGIDYVDAVIAGRVYPVSRFTSVFALNQIPTASISLGLGRDARGIVSPAHDLAKSFVTRRPARILFQARVLDRGGPPGDRVDPGVKHGEPICIFDGDAVGVGWTRTAQSATYGVQLLHWLAALDYASAISGSSHPSNPQEWTTRAAWQSFGPANQNAPAGAVPTAGWLPTVLVDTSAIQKDLWGDVIHKWISQVVLEDPIDRRLARNDNADIRLAVRRLSPFIDGTTRYKPHRVPLAMDVAGVDAVRVGEDIRNELRRSQAEAWINVTLWGKLISEWSPSFWMSVVPRVDDAIVIPFAAALRPVTPDTQWRSIKTSAAVNLQCPLNRSLRAIGMVQPMTFQAAGGMGGAGGAAPLQRLQALTGYYQPDRPVTGVTLLKNLPGWLTKPLQAYILSSRATGADSRPLVTSVDPAVPIPGPNRNDVAALERDRTILANRFAKQWYVLEALKGRSGDLTVPLRFDIAPGSTIQIMSPTSVSVPEPEDGLTQPFYATVQAVSYMIDAESRRAATVLSLSHIRTEAENALDGFSVERPPLYKDAWFGAPLID